MATKKKPAKRKPSKEAILKSQLKETQRALADAIKMLADGSKQSQVNEDKKEYALACGEKMQEPEFATQLNGLTDKLKTTQDFLIYSLNRAEMMDGLPRNLQEKKDKAYRNGVIGVMEQLNDIAQDNRMYSELLLNKLTNLVG
jgi:hypothetical protein